MTRKSTDESLDACPFPPDGPPPPKTLPTNVMELMERFFENWRNYLGLMTIASLVLVYSLFVVPPPLITEASVPDTWKTKHEPKLTPLDYFKWIKVSRPEHNVSGQLILEGDEVLEFRDQTVRFNDLVFVKDNARIILRNSTLIAPDYPEYRYEDIFHEYAGMVFNGSARLEAYDTVIVTKEKHGTHIGFMGSSSCHLENTLIANCSICFDESASLEASNSSFFEVMADRSSSLRLVNSYIRWLRHDNWWRSRFVNPLKEVSTTALLENSTVDLLELRIVNSSRCNLDDYTGKHDFWNPYEGFEVDGCTMNVTLIHSEITEPPFIHCMNCDLNVTGADVLLIHASMSTVYIDDAKIMWLSTIGNSSVVIRDTNINSYSTDAWLPWEDFVRFMSPSSFHQDIAMTSSRIEDMNLETNCDVVFSGVYVDEIRTVDTESSLRGTVTWGQDMTHHYQPYDRFSVTQAFEVMTQGRKRALPDVALVLEDKDGNVVWEGATDEDGYAHFNLTFCSFYPLHEPYQYVTNYLDEWRLTAVSGDATREEAVTMFKTGSPVVFEFPEDELVLPVSNTALTFVSVTLILLATVLKLKNLHF